MAAPTFIASYNTSFEDSTTPRTLSITTQAGDLVIVAMMAEDTISSASISGNGITFTQQYSIGGTPQAMLWTGTDAVGGTNWTLTAANTSAPYYWGIVVYIFRNHSGIGAVSTGAGSGGSTSLTTTAANSAIVSFVVSFGAVDSWQTINSITPTSGNGLRRLYETNSGTYGAASAYYNDVGSAGTYTPGMSSATSPKSFAIEVKGAAGASPSPSVIRNTAEGQSSGTTLTAANSGGGSGYAFDGVDSTGTVTGQFSNAKAIHGSLSYLINASVSSYMQLIFAGQNDGIGAQQAYFYFTAYPSGTCAIMSTYSTDTKSTFCITSDGRFRVYDDAGQVDQSAASVVPLNRWLRVDFITTVGTTTSNGRIQAQVSDADNSSTFYTYDSGPAINTGTANLTEYYYGKIDTAPSFSTFYVDDIALLGGSPSFIPAGETTTYRNTAEGQSSGTTLSAANSGGGSGTAFNTVTVSGTVAVTYSTDISMFGSQSYKVVPSASSAIYARSNTSDAYSGASQMYLYLPTYADNNQLFICIMNSTGSNIARFSIDATGTIRIANVAGSNIQTSSSGVIPTGQWIRLDLSVTVGDSASNGRIMAQASVMNSFTPFWSYDSGATANAGTDPLGEFRFGKLDTTPNIALFYMDGLAWRNNMTAFIPPESSSPAIAWFVA